MVVPPKNSAPPRFKVAFVVGILIGNGTQFLAIGMNKLFGDFIGWQHSS
jgi:hypothetical protein